MLFPCAPKFKMADGGNFLKLTLVYGSAKHKVELACNPTDSGPTVGELAKVAAELTQVPENAQKLIYKGQSLKDMAMLLKPLGIKQGARVMLIGKKYDPEEDESMKAIRAMERKTDDLEKRFGDLLTELDGIQKGFLEVKLVGQSLQKLANKVKTTAESFMKMLEKLDALIVDSALHQVRGKRKSLVQRIQTLIDKTDSTMAQINELRTTSNI